MRLGTEKKRETQVAIGLMVVAVAVSAWKLPGVFFPSAAPAVSEPSSSAPAPAQPRRTSVKNRRGGAMAPVAMIVGNQESRLATRLLCIAAQGCLVARWAHGRITELVDLWSLPAGWVDRSAGH